MRYGAQPGARWTGGGRGIAFEKLRSDRDPGEFGEDFRPIWYRAIGFRILVWVVLIFLATMIVFEGLDLRHEARGLTQAGHAAAPDLRADGLRIHVIHGLVTILLFAAGIFLATHFLITRRIRALLLAVQHFRLGTWRVRIPTHPHDELEWLADAFRRLGPHLEKTVTTYVECDRRATVARLGMSYEKAFTPLARRLLTLGRFKRDRDADSRAWLEVRQTAMRILAELGALGRPEHPAVADIIRPSGPASDASNREPPRRTFGAVRQVEEVDPEAARQRPTVETMNRTTHDPHTDVATGIAAEYGARIPKPPAPSETTTR